MPAGDLLTADWQGELNNLLFGAGTDYEFGPNGVDGLIGFKAKSVDVDLEGDDGAYPGPDYKAAKTILVDYEFNAAGGADDALIAATLLETAWEPVDDGDTLVQIHFQLPGLGHFYLRGRPDGLELNLSLVPKGVVTGIGTFRALDPHRYTVGS